jgi:hypothetical protein
MMYAYEWYRTPAPLKDIDVMKSWSGCFVPNIIDLSEYSGQRVHYTMGAE